MKKEVKNTVIAELGEKLKAYPHFYLVDVTGLNAADTSDLRRKCFKSEIKMVVVKNNLLRKAFEASEIDYSPLYDTLVGNTAVLFTEVANVPGKLLKEYKKAGIPALKAAFAEESFFSSSSLLSRARTNSSLMLSLSSRALQRTLSLLSRLLPEARSTVSSRLSKNANHWDKVVRPKALPLTYYTD